MTKSSYIKKKTLNSMAEESRGNGSLTGDTPQRDVLEIRARDDVGNAFLRGTAEDGRHRGSALTEVLLPFVETTTLLASEAST